MCLIAELRKYLSAIITNLSKANILQSIKGRNGGITFTKKLSKITIQDILYVTECVDTNDCVLGLGKCRIDNKCALHDRWKRSKEEIDKFLDTTLQDLKDK